jgi:opacity protein-like surface antigen
LGTLAFAQTAEFGFSAGYSLFPNTCGTPPTPQGVTLVPPLTQFCGNGALGTLAGAGPSGENVNVLQGNGFRFSFHMTLNTGRYFGHEVGYAYNRTQFTETFVAQAAFTTTSGQTVQAGQTFTQQTGSAIHQGFYDFLVYARPEGARIRPFAAGGVQFDSIPFPGYSVESGATITKFGFNYGAGVKIRVSHQFLIRFDYREYMCGRPNYGGSGVQFDIPGLLRQQVVTAGVAYVL